MIKFIKNWGIFILLAAVIVINFAEKKKQPAPEYYTVMGQKIEKPNTDVEPEKAEAIKWINSKANAYISNVEFGSRKFLDEKDGSYSIVNRTILNINQGKLLITKHYSTILKLKTGKYFEEDRKKDWFIMRTKTISEKQFVEIDLKKIKSAIVGKNRFGHSEVILKSKKLIHTSFPCRYTREFLQPEPKYKISKGWNGKTKLVKIPSDEPMNSNFEYTNPDYPSDTFIYDKKITTTYSSNQKNCRSFNTYLERKVPFVAIRESDIRNPTITILTSSKYGAEIIAANLNAFSSGWSLW